MRWPLLLLSILFVLGYPAELRAQWLVSAYGGSIHTAAADLAIEQPALGTELTFPDVPFESRSFDSPIYYGYRLAVRVPATRWFFVEVELIHGKLFAKAMDAPAGVGRHRGATVNEIPFGSVVQAFGISHGLNFLLVNTLVRVPAGDARQWRLAARVGAGPMFPHPETEIGGARREGYELSGLGLQVSAGIERNLWRNLIAFADYKFTRAEMSLSVHQGTVRLTTHSHHVAFGMGLQF